MKKKPGKPVVDERQRRYIERAALHALLAGIVLDLAMMGYHFVTRQMEKGYPYLFQLFILGFFFWIATLTKADPELPRSFLGKALNPEEGRSALMTRIAWYAVDTVVFLTGYKLFTYYQERTWGEDVVSTLVIALIIVLAFNTIVGELKIRTYRRQMQQMDEEEND